MGLYRGVANVAREIKEEWRGVGNVARKIVEEWRGVSNVARKCYQGVDPSILYNYGNECVEVTGGWKSTYETYNGSTWNGGTHTLTKGSSSMSIEIPRTNNIVPSSSGCIVTVNKIDLTNWNKICIELGTLSCNGATTSLPNASVVDVRMTACVSATQNQYVYNIPASKNCARWYIGWPYDEYGYQQRKTEHYNHQNTTVEIDVSGITGSYYVFALTAIGVSSEGVQSQAIGTVKKVWLA